MTSEFKKFVEPGDEMQKLNCSLCHDNYDYNSLHKCVPYNAISGLHKCVPYNAISGPLPRMTEQQKGKVNQLAYKMSACRIDYELAFKEFKDYINSL